MFAPNALPLPTSFGHEHRPLRLTGEAARPQPQGGCHYQKSPEQQDKCFCQSFQHDRRAPGNICDCGHSACYHSSTPYNGGLSPDTVITALAEKVKRLEDSIIKERAARKDELSRERQVWERESRTLREALSPFYRNEQDVRRKLLEVEDKVNFTYDEHVHLRERVAAIDEASIALERRLRVWQDTHCRKRKASIDTDAPGVMSPESNYTSASSTDSDVSSLSTHLSPSPIKVPLPLNTVTVSPRSSGILHNRVTSNNNPNRSLGHNPRQVQLSGTNEEPRSSGFLSIDLAERVQRKRPNPLEGKGSLQPIAHLTSGHKTVTPSVKPTGLPSPLEGKAMTGALPVSYLLSGDPDRSSLDLRSPKKRKQQEGRSIALDVLANASIADACAR